ncbi:universal stress protein [Streptomyces neyagawaensis]|uniref:universal stress protein n=1 Tax=Streptomyces neyagawaensis TaxID=42238 RepID=UPI0006E3F5B2|nr:universal stress protein [Streptomyces neyagawaensis]MCL6735977.1 universal stress protein [Streptomyces neyagawaensis]MDE1686895.1 universal stress protein [Streptomyces neyagawaensis]
MGQALTVGLDGSPESVAAAHWAADEAERRNLTLRLLHAWPLLVPEPTRLPSEVDQNYWARRLMHHAKAEIQARNPGLTVVGNLVAEDAQHALIQAAAESEMLVLGSRGVSQAESYFLGDISVSVVGHAERPVVLVRAEERDEERPRGSGAEGAVVVALKLHGPSDDLLEFAFSTAAGRGVPLRAVHGHGVPLHAFTPWGMDHTVTHDAKREAHTSLSRALRPWREKFPGVDVSDTVRLDSPARAVLSAVEGAGLLVVGRRRHRHTPVPRLGPVAQAAVHHARCPVAVVPHG